MVIKKYNIYALIVVVLLIMPLLLQCSEGTESSKSLTPEEKAISLVKYHKEDTGEYGHMYWVDIIKQWMVEDKEMFPIGWDAVQVSESMYCVRFREATNGIVNSFYFHVILKDKIVKWIRSKTDFENYLETLITVSTYSKDELRDIVTNFINDDK